jgi:hypothetical protein
MKSGVKAIGHALHRNKRVKNAVPCGMVNLDIILYNRLYSGT